MWGGLGILGNDFTGIKQRRFTRGYLASLRASFGPVLLKDVFENPNRFSAGCRTGQACSAVFQRRMGRDRQRHEDNAKQAPEPPQVRHFRHRRLQSNCRLRTGKLGQASFAPAVTLLEILPVSPALSTSPPEQK